MVGTQEPSRGDAASGSSQPGGSATSSSKHDNEAILSRTRVERPDLKQFASLDVSAPLPRQAALSHPPQCTPPHKEHGWMAV